MTRTRKTKSIRVFRMAIPDAIMKDCGDIPIDQVQQVSIEWAALLLTCSTRTIRRMVERGDLQATGSETGRRITVASIRDYIKGK